MLMNFLMDQENFYDYFFQTKRDNGQPVITEDAKLVQMLQGEEEVAKYDQLLSLAVTGGDYNWR